MQAYKSTWIMSIKILGLLVQATVHNVHDQASYNQRWPWSLAVAIFISPDFLL